MTSCMLIPTETGERIAAYMRVALLALNEKFPASPRGAELAGDLEDFLAILLKSRLSSGWHPYPDIRPKDGLDAIVALKTGETFPDAYYAGSWRTQRDSDVQAWVPAVESEHEIPKK